MEAIDTLGTTSQGKKKIRAGILKLTSDDHPSLKQLHKVFINEDGSIRPDIYLKSIVSDLKEILELVLSYDNLYFHLHSFASPNKYKSLVFFVYQVRSKQSDPDVFSTIISMLDGKLKEIGSDILSMILQPVDNKLLIKAELLPQNIRTNCTVEMGLHEIPWFLEQMEYIIKPLISKTPVPRWEGQFFFGRDWKHQSIMLDHPRNMLVVGKEELLPNILAAKFINHAIILTSNPKIWQQQIDSGATITFHNIDNLGMSFLRVCKEYRGVAIKSMMAWQQLVAGNFNDWIVFGEVLDELFDQIAILEEYSISMLVEESSTIWDDLSAQQLKQSIQSKYSGIFQMGFFQKDKETDLFKGGFHVIDISELFVEEITALNIFFMTLAEHYLKDTWVFVNDLNYLQEASLYDSFEKIISQMDLRNICIRLSNMDSKPNWLKRIGVSIFDLQSARISIQVQTQLALDTLKNYGMPIVYTNYQKPTVLKLEEYVLDKELIPISEVQGQEIREEIGGNEGIEEEIEDELAEDPVEDEVDRAHDQAMDLLYTVPILASMMEFKGYTIDEIGYRVDLDRTINELLDILVNENSIEYNESDNKYHIHHNGRSQINQLIKSISPSEFFSEFKSGKSNAVVLSELKSRFTKEEEVSGKIVVLRDLVYFMRLLMDSGNEVQGKFYYQSLGLYAAILEAKFEESSSMHRITLEFVVIVKELGEYWKSKVDDAFDKLIEDLDINSEQEQSIEEIIEQDDELKEYIPEEPDTEKSEESPSIDEEISEITNEDEQSDPVPDPVHKPLSVYIDGPNVVYFNCDPDNKEAKADYIQFVINDLQKIDPTIDITVVVSTALYKYNIDRPEYLKALKREGRLIIADAKTDDDKPCIRFARKDDAFIITRDQYRNHRENLKLSRWLKERVIKFDLYPRKGLCNLTRFSDDINFEDIVEEYKLYHQDTVDLTKVVVNQTTSIEVVEPKKSSIFPQEESSPIKPSILQPVDHAEGVGDWARFSEYDYDKTSITYTADEFVFMCIAASTIKHSYMMEYNKLLQSLPLYLDVSIDRLLKKNILYGNDQLSTTFTLDQFAKIPGKVGSIDPMQQIKSFLEFLQSRPQVRDIPLEFLQDIWSLADGKKGRWLQVDTCLRALILSLYNYRVLGTEFNNIIGWLSILLKTRFLHVDASLAFLPPFLMNAYARYDVASIDKVLTTKVVDQFIKPGEFQAAFMLCSVLHIEQSKTKTQSIPPVLPGANLSLPKLPMHIPTCTESDFDHIDLQEEKKEIIEQAQEEIKEINYREIRLSWLEGISNKKIEYLMKGNVVYVRDILLMENKMEGLMKLKNIGKATANDIIKVVDSFIECSQPMEKIKQELRMKVVMPDVPSSAPHYADDVLPITDEPQVVGLLKSSDQFTLSEETINQIRTLGNEVFDEGIEVFFFKMFTEILLPSLDKELIVNDLSIEEIISKFNKVGSETSTLTTQLTSNYRASLENYQSYPDMRIHLMKTFIESTLKNLGEFKFNRGFIITLLKLFK
ncbi:MAG: NYN domain-containing protein [Candidatus Kariarchaeaceae archaeon]|jgi:hypothetical protein